MFVYVYDHACMYVYTDMDIPRSVHEYVFVFVFVTVFTVTCGAHIYVISFDGNLVCFSCLHIITTGEEAQNWRPARINGLAYGFSRFLC